MYYPYCESWHTALQKVCSTGHKRPSRVQKKSAEGFGWQIRHPVDHRDETWVAWGTEMWQANCLTYQSSESYGTQAIQGDTGGWEAWAGRFSTHRGVTKNRLTHLLYGECKAEHLSWSWNIYIQTDRQRHPKTQKMETVWQKVWQIGI